MYQKRKIKNSPIVYFGINYSLIVFAVAVIFGIFGHLSSLWSFWYSFIFIIPIIFILYFFRNPKRDYDFTPEQIASPADGKVLSITEIEYDEFIGGKAINVSIFLSVFNVHVNRSPIKGVVKYHSYRPGKMLPAFKSHASDINERNTIGIKADDGFKVIVHQITGFIARRIVWWVKPEDNISQSERFGLIKFGSCTQIVVPHDTKILVTPGQKVYGAKTVIGEKNEIS